MGPSVHTSFFLILILVFNIGKGEAMQNRRAHAPTDGKAVVAQNPVVIIEACTCGVFHLHFGPISLRLTEESLEHVRRGIAQALAHANQPTGTEALFRAGGPLRGEA